MEDKNGGLNGIDVAVSIATELDLAVRRRSKRDVFNLMKRCQKFVADNTPSEYDDGERSVRMIELNPNSKVTGFLNGYVNAKVNCQNLELNAELAAFAGVGVSAGVSICHSSSGRRWLEVVGGFGYSIGAAAAVDIGLGRSNRDENNSKNPLSLSEESGWLAGVVGVYREQADCTNDEYSGHEWFNNLIGGADAWKKIRGFGFGAGIVESRKLKLHVEIIPLPTSSDVAEQIFLGRK